MTPTNRDAQTVTGTETELKEFRQMVMNVTNPTHVIKWLYSMRIRNEKGRVGFLSISETRPIQNHNQN